MIFIPSEERLFAAIKKLHHLLLQIVDHLQHLILQIYKTCIPSQGPKCYLLFHQLHLHLVRRGQQLNISVRNTYSMASESDSGLPEEMAVIS